MVGTVVVGSMMVSLSRGMAPRRELPLHAEPGIPAGTCTERDASRPIGVIRYSQNADRQKECTHGIEFR